MSERRVQTRSIPLRVRFRSTGEIQSGREQTGSYGSSESPRSAQAAVPAGVQTEQRNRQIRELLRLCDLLRADLELDVILQQVAVAISVCTSFRALAICLLDEPGKMLSTVAVAGVSDEDHRLLSEHVFPIDALFNLMRPQFRISQSFYIPHEQMRLLADRTVVTVRSIETEREENYEPGQWHPDDNLVVPLYSLREQKLLGCLLLDDPEDNNTPTRESIEIVELFANKAVVAIDNTRLLKEREKEQKLLEESIAVLCEDLEQLREVDLRQNVRVVHKKLQPAVEAINAMLDRVGLILYDMQKIVQVVDDHTYNVKGHTEQLAHETQKQDEKIQGATLVVRDIAGKMEDLTERSAILSRTVIEAVDVTVETQTAMDRAVEGMGRVREATMQSARAMKTLGESGQEINEAVLAMTDLTTRMHLLALNAAIEATRAGEQGQGFAIIAQEIRTLALHCSEAARKVGGYIRTVQDEVTEVSHSVEQSTQQVVMQTELVAQTSVALEAIGIVVVQLTDLVHSIGESAQTQLQGSQSAVNSLQDLSKTRGNVVHKMEKMQQSTRDLMELTNGLRARLIDVHLSERES